MPAPYADLADQQEFLAHARDPGLLRREVDGLAGSGLGEDDIVGIELKTGRTVSPWNTRGLRSLAAA